MRDEIVDFVRMLSDKTELIAERFVSWLGMHRSQFFRWKQRYGKVNQNNAHVPRDNWITDEEKAVIIEYHDRNPLEGYRRLTYMMIDHDVAYVAPATTYRILKGAGRLDRWNAKPSSKGKGFTQPLEPHEHWHVDMSYLNVAGTFYYLCAVLDGFSRSIIHWSIRESMTERDVEQVIERARELYPEAKPRIITDNGSQFTAKDFKEYIRLTGMTHVRTAPYYPQSNGKLERWNQTMKVNTVRVRQPETLEEAKRLVERFVQHYNTTRLHSAIGYVAPHDKLAGRAKAIQAERDRKLELARERRRAVCATKRSSDVQHVANHTCAA